jgi:large subunit ribosomal protein L17
MRHNVRLRKLGRTSGHRRALLRSLTTSLFRHERIRTTLPKAKELRSFAEKLITLARRDDLHARRLVLRQVDDKDVVKKLFTTLGPRRAGGIRGAGQEAARGAQGASRQAGGRQQEARGRVDAAGRPRVAGREEGIEGDRAGLQPRAAMRPIRSLDACRLRSPTTRTVPP